MAVAVCDAGLEESVASTVTVDGPVPVGVPLMMPLLGSRVRPAGSVPELTDQLYGAAPPVAVRA